MPNLPKGFRAGGGLLAAVIAGGILLSSSLYNGKKADMTPDSTLMSNSPLVDGGHRAIKYSR